MPPWRPVLDAALRAHEGRAASSNVQLATAGPDGRPANRTVVFRGFIDPGAGLLFTTDTRSAKAEHLRTNPWVELCWYFPETREQFRLLGRAGLEHDDLANLWRSLPGPTRQSFTWPQPGAPHDPDDAFALPIPAAPPPNFGVLVVTPERVEHLDLRPHPHSRTVYSLSGADWSAERVNP
jgi:PPOX class probable FMN-dependent enzyme